MGFKLRNKPYGKYQMDAITWMAHRNHGALLLPMGTGKTYAMLARMSLHAGTILVVCPLSVIRSWETQIEEHTTASYAVAHGSPSERKRALTSDADIILINYDYFSRINKAKMTKMEKQSYEQLFSGFNMVVLDESTRIKSPRSKVTVNVIELLGHAKYRYLLTGNPVPRGLEDLWSQWRFMDGGTCLGTNYFKFLSKYFRPQALGGGKRMWLISEKGSKRISNDIKGTYHYKKKEDCVDLPPKVYTTYYYDLTPEQMKVYRSIVTEWLTPHQTEEDSVRTVNNPLSRDMVLRQICAGYMGSGSGVVYDEYKTRKYDYLIDIINGIEPDHPIVIWFVFNEELKRLRKVMGTLKRTHYEIYGGVPRSERGPIMDKVIKEKAILLIQIQTGAYGINELAEIDYAIYFSNTYDYDLRSQSEDRTTRIGSERSCTYIDLVGRKTIEEAIVQVLKKKSMLPEAAFKDELKDIIRGWK